MEVGMDATNVVCKSSAMRAALTTPLHTANKPHSNIPILSNTEKV
jgi:hypothetical protein